MKQKRDERRKKAEDEKKLKLEKEAENFAAGKMGDVDFEMMMQKYRLGVENMRQHLSPENLKINICVRKRPIFKKELSGGELDCVSVANPQIIVHDCKLRVDGLTKYVDNHEFNFDNVRTEVINLGLF
jgi:kinesin family protein 2/24